MRTLRFLLGLAAAVLVHALGSQVLPRFPSAVDLFLVLAVLHALDGRLIAGMLGGTVAGLTADGLSGGLFGLNGFVDTIIGYGAALAARRLVIQRASSIALVCAAATVAQQLLLMGLGLALISQAHPPLTGWMLAKVAVNGGLGAVLSVLGSRLRVRYERWRQSRGSRLRFDR